MSKPCLGRDFEVEIRIIPYDEEYYPNFDGILIRSATCISDLDTLVGRGSNFLNELPEADNHTKWE